MLSGASFTTWHKVFSVTLCNVCPKKIKATLKNVFLVHCCLQPQGEHYIGILLWDIVPKVLKEHCTGFFLCNVICSLLGNIAQGFHLCNVVPKVLRQHLTGFFPLQCCLDNIVQYFYLCNVVPRVLRQQWTKFFPCIVVHVVLREFKQHWTGFFLVQYRLEPLRQHCTRFLPLAMLAHGQKKTFLSKRTYTMLFIKLGQHCIWILYTQCCPNKSEKTLHKKITDAMFAQTT